VNDETTEGRNLLGQLWIAEDHRKTVSFVAEVCLGDDNAKPIICPITTLSQPSQGPASSHQQTPLRGPDKYLLHGKLGVFEVLFGMGKCTWDTFHSPSFYSYKLNYFSFNNFTMHCYKIEEA